MGERHEHRGEATVGCLCDRYLSEHVAAHKKASTAAEARRLVEKQIRPALGKLKISDLTRAEVKAWHSARSATPTTANRALAALSKLMNLAVHEWELCTDNPCKGIKRFPERKRERYFSDSELQRIGDVLAALEREEAVFPGCIIAVRLLALTGMRLGEVLSLRWPWIDLNAAILALPEAKAGARTVGLSAPVVQLLASLERKGSYVVHGVDPDKSLSASTLEHVWDRVRRAAGIPDARLHDLRHSVGTFAAHAGGNAFLIRDLLGHKTLAMTGRYVERAVDPVRALADKVSGRIAAAMSGAHAEVVPLRDKR
jgi:integrase